MYYALSFLVVYLLTLLVWYKYSIDTRLTIQSIKEDRDKYRNQLWQMIKGLDKEREFYQNKQNNTMYKDLKEKINILHKDLSETDFDSYANIKKEILLALKQIDSYGENNDTGKN